jgi:putative hydrolase of the HAD superfamily
VRFELAVFDLDDTLYPEIEYVTSGFRAVASAITDHDDLRDRYVADLLRLFWQHPLGVFDRFVSELAAGGARHRAPDLVEVYRSHPPTALHLYPDVLPTLRHLRQGGIRTAVVTDGRASSQIAKVEALGLEPEVDAIIVTDALAEGRAHWKPSPHAFALLLTKFRAEPSRSFYVGDNPEKDFQGPLSLGMQSFFIERTNGLRKHLRPETELSIPASVGRITSLADLLA